MSKKRWSISQKDVEAWIATNPDHRAILKETLVDYVTMEVVKKISEFKEDIRIQINRIMRKEFRNQPEIIGSATVNSFLGCISAAANVFLSRWKERYQEPEIEPEECRKWAVEKSEEWMGFFFSWELGDLFKNRQAIRKVIAQMVARYLTESFWNKLEGSAMRNDPMMRRLIMRDMLGGE